MKKQFLILLLIPFLFIGCASNQFTPEFNVEYDKASGVSTTQETNLTKKYMPNLASDLGSNEWLEMEIWQIKPSYTALYTNWIYQGKNWLFVKQIEFYDDNGNKLYLSDNKPVRSVIDADNVIEKMTHSMTDKEIETLYKLAQEENLYCVFIGSDYRTKEIKVKPKIKKSIVATIDKYNELKK